MMSTSSDYAGNLTNPVKSFQYPSALIAGSVSDAGSTEMQPVVEPSAPMTGTGITDNDLAAAYEKGRHEGRQEAEKRYNQQLAQAVTDERIRVEKVVNEFRQGSSEYYSKVEDQVVHLALGIATKILHRESQVDPLLVAALVKIAIENLKQGSRIQVSIHPAEIKSWRKYFELEDNGKVIVELIEDSSLKVGECIVDSEVGVASMGITAQLKEIEHGLFDLLAQRPKND
jgi:flagellar assembly protein FliH